MKKIVKCPYNVGFAKDIWMEGFSAGVKSASEYFELKTPKLGRDIVVEFKDRDHKLDAMRQLPEDKYRNS